MIDDIWNVVVPFCGPVERSHGPKRGRRESVVGHYLPWSATALLATSWATRRATIKYLQEDPRGMIFVQTLIQHKHDNRLPTDGFPVWIRPPILWNMRGGHLHRYVAQALRQRLPNIAHQLCPLFPRHAGFRSWICGLRTDDQVGQNNKKQCLRKKTNR